MAEPSPRSRWPLYHGTSTLRLRQILQDNNLRASADAEKVALTTERSVAAYFALEAVEIDRHERPGQETRPVILVLDGEALVRLRLIMDSYPEDPDDDAHDWENELACWDDIEPLHQFLIGVEEVPPGLYEICRSGAGREPFQPPRPWLIDRIVERDVPNFFDLYADLLHESPSQDLRKPAESAKVKTKKRSGRGGKSPST